jgi:hypothetical protein
MKRMIVSLAWAIFMVSMAEAGEVEFVEDFALAKDRAVSLRQLIPGTEDYYYYHCLHYLNTEQFEKVEEFTRPWLQRLGQTPRLTEIQTRHALLTYPRNPERSLAYLRKRLDLRFDHQKELGGAAPNLPTSLDPKLIARGTLRAYSIANWQNLDNFEDAALDWLAAGDLNWERRRNLLQRLARPDLANLPKLIAEDFQAPHPPEFGAFPVHRQLTLVQLEELVRLRTDLLNHLALVQTWISKLHPGADADWRHDRGLTRAYLDQLQSFVSRLEPVHNSLKAHVLYHRLAFDRAQGIYDKDRFLAYLQLPRRQPYMAKAMLEREIRFPVDLNAEFTGVTLLPAIRIDEELVRDYLKHFLLEADSTKEFEPYINDVYLRHLFAETKIENGLGDEEQWASLLPPELFRQLKDRIDIDFAATNKTDFAADEPVRLDLFVKNVPTLLVKIFEVNTLNFYRTQQREVDTDINLDGLVANVEETRPYADPPLRRTSRRFEFPQLKNPGVYVVDFIGSGKSSRALIRKGRLRPLVGVGTAGQVVTVVDDANRPVKDAAVWFGGAEYRPDKDGRIVFPFSTNPGRQPIVLHRGDFACLDFLEHQAENYHLQAGIHVDREALLTQRVAAVLVRPGLLLNGKPVSIKLLEEVKLRITATDHAGIATSTEIPNFKLFEDRESIHDFRVPSRLASLNVTLLAKVKSLSQNKTLDLAASETFALNEIERTEKTEDLHLAKFGADYVIELLGRTGEQKADRAVQLALKHRDFRRPVQTVLKTDAQGRLRLGVLTDIVSVTATGPEGISHTWPLPLDRHTYRQLVHAKAGEVISLPYLGAAAKPTREELALFEVQGDVIRADRFDAVTIKDSMLELQDLPAGDYDLWLKWSGERVRIRVVDGSVQGDYVLGKMRYLQLPMLKPVQIAAITADAEQVAIRLRDVSPFTRVHVFATRYQPAFSAFADLGRVRDAEPSGVYPTHAESVYLTGRNIGDEYRYVLDRRGQKKYAGNMLERPGLLLNPWAVRSTETGEQFAAPGREFGGVGGPRPSEAVPSPPAGVEGMLGRKGALATGDFANLDFLADASAVVLNQVPDKDGVVHVSRKAMGPHAMIHVVAVDPLNTTYRGMTLAEQRAMFVDLRLRNGLDPKGHFTQQKQVTILSPGQPFVLEDVAGSKFEAYDSLPKVYGLFVTLSRDPKLAEFAFLLNWPKLKPEEKSALYSKYASHELHFFLAKKDPAFFKAVVLPYLANKKDKTFMDRWLLQEDLSEYLQPWWYGRLNTVERILLAQRLQGEPAKTARYVNDLVRLQPPNIDRFMMLFDTAVKSGALETEDALGLLKEKMEAPKNRPEPLMPKSAMQEAPARAPEAVSREMMKRGALGGKAGAEPADKLGEDRKAGKDAKKAVDGTELKEQSRRLQKAELFFADDREKAAFRQLYRRLEPTMEWAENNYYQLLIEQQLADLVTVSPFWLDYARYDGKGPFLSRNLADASRNFTEMIFALAVLDLPYEAGKHEVKFDAGRMTLTPASPVIAFHEGVRPVAGQAGQTPILISQNFYRLGDRYREENGEKIDKFVTGEFLAQTVYGCQVVVTNPTSARQKLSVLTQLPVGAVPVSNGQFTKSVMLDLEPYRTQAIDYFFYFPLPGKFVQFPVHVAKNEKFIASAAPVVFDVVEKPSKLDTSSWEYVSQNGTGEEVLAMLVRENVFALNLEKIAFRMKDRAFFEAVLQSLRERHAFQATLWSYALLHNDPAAARQYFAHVDQIVNECGGPIRSPLLTVDPVARHQYEHLEYKPLVNARAHSLGQRRQIVNGRLHEQYHRFLKLLSYHPQLTNEDKLGVTYYLLLQDRIEEGLATFAQVQPDQLATRLQYDYCAAYLELFGDEPERARAISARYAEYPVDRWRNAFVTLVHQLTEPEGKGSKVLAAGHGNGDLGDPDRGQRQGVLAATEPAFDFTLDAKQIHLTWQNLNEVRVNYYLMDVELLFSRNPFVQEVSGPFASIRPNATQIVKLLAGDASKVKGDGVGNPPPTVAQMLAIPLPKDLASRNVLVEVTAAGKTRSHPYYANAMNVRLLENYGQLLVIESANGRAVAAGSESRVQDPRGLPKVYVKVYARLADGTVKFHKDGYTDHRGRFDYASVSTPDRQPISRFAILVLSEERGALIQETSPPQQ